MTEHLMPLERAWRTCATGLCFSSFGLGGLLLRVLVFPVLALLPWSATRRKRICKDVVHYAFRLFVWLMCTSGVIRCEVRNAERLRRQGLLIVANHPSLVDVVLLIALTRRTDCVVKAALADNPFTRGPVRATGYVLNDSGVTMVQGCIDSLRAGNNLLIFPEGTRTPADGQIRLQRGVANIAVRGGFDLTPVVIRCAPPLLRKGDKWYRVPVRRPRFVVDVQEDLDPTQFFAAGADDAMAVRAVTHALTEYFSREVRRGGA